MSFKEEIIVSTNEPLPPKEQLELARIQSATKIAKTQSSVQGVAIFIVGVIVTSLIAGSIILTIKNKEVPSWFATTISIAITGLVGVVSYNAGSESERRKSND